MCGKALAFEYAKEGITDQRNKSKSTIYRAAWRVVRSG